MTPIEIIALILLTIGFVKLIVILWSPRSWVKVMRVVYTNTVVTMIVVAVLMLITLYYLLQELNIIHIFAAMMFTSLLILLSLAPYGQVVATWSEKLLRDRKIMQKAWLSILVWLVLMLWVLYALLTQAY